MNKSTYILMTWTKLRSSCSIALNNIPYLINIEKRLFYLVAMDKDE